MIHIPENLMGDTKEIMANSRQIVAIRKNPLLVLDLKEVNKQATLQLNDLLRGRCFEVLDVILQTPGGDIDAAFVIAKILRKRASQLNIIVPLYAKSAGTLICLAADNLFMNDLSELGPLDSQIPEVRDGGAPEYISALNGFKALEQVQLHTIETLDITTKLLLERSQMKIPEAVHLASEFSGKTSGTLYSRLDPAKIGEYARALEIGERYGKLILTRYMNWPVEKADRTIKTLVKQYPSHGFVIDAEELASLGLPAQEMEKELVEIIPLMRKNLLLNEETVIELVEQQSTPLGETLAKEGNPTEKTK